jgi:hypothetical protein
MNRRLALTVAGSSALVVITAGAAVAANLGILTASSGSNVGQLDATRVAELAVSTPASIDASRAALPVVSPAPDASVPPVVVSQPSAGFTPSTPVPVSAAVQTASASEVSVAETAPASESVTPPSAPSTPSTHGSEIKTTDHVEGSLDDPAQDDAFAIETPHHIEAVTVSETDN